MLVHLFPGWKIADELSLCTMANNIGKENCGVMRFCGAWRLNGTFLLRNNLSLLNFFFFCIKEWLSPHALRYRLIGAWVCTQTSSGMLAVVAGRDFIIIKFICKRTTCALSVCVMCVLDLRSPSSSAPFSHLVIIEMEWCLRLLQTVRTAWGHNLYKIVLVCMGLDLLEIADAM